MGWPTWMRFGMFSKIRTDRSVSSGLMHGKLGKTHYKRHSRSGSSGSNWIPTGQYTLCGTICGVHGPFPALFDGFREDIELSFIGSFGGSGCTLTLAPRSSTSGPSVFEASKRACQSALVQVRQPSGENDLGSKSRFDVAGKNGAVADLRRDDLIDGQQGTLAKISFLRIGVGVGSRCAGRFAVKVGSIVVAAAIHNLRSKPREQCLRAFRAIN